jgi:hypothetical protein
MPRGVKKVLENVQKRPVLARPSRTLAEQRIKGDAPALGIIKADKKKEKKKPTLRKTNSKGEVVKAKKIPAYKGLIKLCIVHDASRKGTYVTSSILCRLYFYILSTIQAIGKYITTNYGAVNSAALKRALSKGVAEGRLVKSGTVCEHRSFNFLSSWPDTALIFFRFVISSPKKRRKTKREKQK